MNRMLSATLALMLLGLATSGRTQEPEILVEVDREEVFLGEPLRLRVLLNHCEGSVEPEVSRAEPYEMRLLKKTIVNTSVVQSDGFRTRQIVRKGPLYEYLLKPRETGEILLPTFAAPIDGNVVRSPEMKIRVRGLEQQDLVRLSIVAEPARLYPTQSFVVQLRIAVKGLPEPNRDREPLSFLGRLPSLDIPWVDDSALPAGLTPQSPWQRWLNDLVDQRGTGFAINELQGRRDLFAELLNGNPFDVLRENTLEPSRDSRLPFHPPVTRKPMADDQGRQVEYWEYSLDRRFETDRVGRFTFGPVTLKGGFAIAGDSSSSMRAESVYAMANATTIEVVEPPEKDRPASYTGGIGQFEITAALSPREAQVGDPMTLTIALQGTGTFQRAAPPPLEELPSLSEAFKIYDPTVETDERQRRFVFAVRPKHAQVSEFPSIEFSYFDAISEEYVTLRTRPINVDIRPAAAVGSDEIAVASPGSNRSFDVEEGGIFANITDVRQLRDQSIQPQKWLWSVVVLSFGFAAIATTKRVLDHRRNNPAFRRRRIARQRVQLRLAAARESAEKHQWREMAEQCSAALVGLAADVADLPELACTAAEASSQLELAGIPAELVQDFDALLQDCEASRFAQGASSNPQLLDRSARLTETLLVELKARKLVS